MSAQSAILRRWLLAAFAVASQADAAGRAQDLKIELAYQRVRSNGPILASAKLTYTGHRLLEGRLELLIRSAGMVIASCRTGELALATGEQTFDLLVPAPRVVGYEAQVEVFPRFVTRDETLEFDPVTWLTPRPRERSCVIGVSHVREDWGERHDRMMRALALEELQPKPSSPDRRTLFTQPVRLAPEELPVQPAAYCAFDLLLLAGKGFAFLRERQLDAILRWVRAGGSVCVVPSGMLGAGHAKFLDDLADSASPAFRLDANGRLVGDTALPLARTFHSGLGRAAIVLELPATDDALRSREWRRVLAFLWKVRAAQVDPILKGGVWRADQEKSPRAVWGVALDPKDLELRLHHIPFYQLGRIIGGLMPQDVRVVPLSIIVLILVAFVLVVGPLDYFVLGKLKQRRLTWLVFPLVAAAFTFFTVRLADHYMGRRDYRRAVTFVDFDARNRPVRQSRYELVFSATERTVRHELKNCLFYPMDAADASLATVIDPYGDRVGQRYSRGGMPDDSGAGGGGPCYEGRLPGHYTVAQGVHQWEAILNKTFSLDPPARLLDLRWDSVRIADLRGDIRSKLMSDPSANAIIFVFHQGERTNLSGYAPGTSQFLTSTSYYDTSLLQRICVYPQVGLFSVVSQISPTGAPNFEDLAMLDPTDPCQWLLVVIHQDGDDLVVYRRLYRGEP